MENKLLGYNIRREREKLGLSQTELGKLIDATKQTVSNWENGNRTPTNKTIDKLATIFNVSMDDLTGRSNIQHLGRVYRYSEELTEYIELAREIENLNDKDKKIIKELIRSLNDKDK